MLKIFVIVFIKDISGIMLQYGLHKMLRTWVRLSQRLKVDNIWQQEVNVDMLEESDDDRLFNYPFVQLFVMQFPQKWENTGKSVIGCEI